MAWSAFNFRAGVAPGAGNGAARFESEGDAENLALRLHATWYLLSRPTTPFLTAGVGVIFFDAELDEPAGERVLDLSVVRPGVRADAPRTRSRG